MWYGSTERATGVLAQGTVGPAGQTVIALLCVGVGGLFTLVGAGYLQMYNRLRKTEPADIGALEATSEAVELTGTARPHESTSTAPFTQTAALVYDWTVTEFRDTSRSGSTRVTLDTGDHRAPFVLAGDTGTALVLPASATLELPDEERITVGPDDSPPSAVSRYLAGTDGVDAEHDCEREYAERRLEPGEPVHVFGPVQATAQSEELPGGVDALVGIDDPDRGFTVGEDSLSDLAEQITSKTTRVTVTVGDEGEAERHLLEKGLAIGGFGVVLGLAALVSVVVL